MKGKTVLVVGVTGQFGDAIAEVCSELGAIVIGASRDQLGMRIFQGLLRQPRPAYTYRCDVTDKAQVRALSVKMGVPDFIIYCVGHCVPGGAKEILGRSMADVPVEEFQEDIGRLCAGLHNILVTFVPGMLSGGRVLVIGSAITRFVSQGISIPAFLLPACSYTCAEAAQDMLISHWRRLLQEQEVPVQLIHLKPGAVQTHFFDGMPKKPAGAWTLEEVSKKVVDCLLNPNAQPDEIWVHPNELG